MKTFKQFIREVAEPIPDVRDFGVTDPFAPGKGGHHTFPTDFSWEDGGFWTPDYEFVPLDDAPQGTPERFPHPLNPRFVWFPWGWHDTDLPLRKPLHRDDAPDEGIPSYRPLISDPEK